MGLTARHLGQVHEAVPSAAGFADDPGSESTSESYAPHREYTWSLTRAGTHGDVVADSSPALSVETAEGGRVGGWARGRAPLLAAALSSRT